MIKCSTSHDGNVKVFTSRKMFFLSFLCVLTTLLCLIVGGGGGGGLNKMHQGKNYQDFLKWRGHF